MWSVKNRQESSTLVGDQLRRYLAGERGGGEAGMGEQERGGRMATRPELSSETGWKEKEYVLCLISANSCLHRVRCLPGSKVY